MWYVLQWFYKPEVPRRSQRLEQAKHKAKLELRRDRRTARLVAASQLVPLTLVLLGLGLAVCTALLTVVWKMWNASSSADTVGLIEALSAVSATMLGTLTVKLMPCLHRLGRIHLQAERWISRTIALVDLGRNEAEIRETMCEYDRRS